MSSRVTGRYVKFSFRLSLAIFDMRSGFTLFTLSPPGFSFSGIHWSRRSLTASVRESLEGCSGFGAVGFVTLRVYLFFLDLRFFLLVLRFFLLFLEEVWVVPAFVRFLAA